MGEKVWIVPNDAEFSVDIDSEFDFWIAEEYLKRIKNKEEYEL